MRNITTHIITEIESILNCRLTTDIYDDDFNETLTPSHLMYEYKILFQNDL